MAIDSLNLIVMDSKESSKTTNFQTELTSTTMAPQTPSSRQFHRHNPPTPKIAPSANPKSMIRLENHTTSRPAFASSARRLAPILPVRSLVYKAYTCQNHVKSSQEKNQPMSFSTRIYGFSNSAFGRLRLETPYALCMEILTAPRGVEGKIRTTAA